MLGMVTFMDEQLLQIGTLIDAGRINTAEILKILTGEGMLFEGDIYSSGDPLEMPVWAKPALDLGDYKQV